MSGHRNNIVYKREFLKDARRLPTEIQQKLGALLELLEEDVFHSLLHTKPLSPPLQGMFTFRITRDYRVGFKLLTPFTVQLLATDRRDKIYKRLLRKL